MVLRSLVLLYHKLEERWPIRNSVLVCTGDFQGFFSDITVIPRPLLTAKCSLQCYLHCHLRYTLYGIKKYFASRFKEEKDMLRISEEIPDFLRLPAVTSF